MNSFSLTRDHPHATPTGRGRWVEQNSSDSLRTHVLAELRRLDLDAELSGHDGECVVRRDAYAGSFVMGLREFSELAATLEDGSGLRGFYLARDGFRDESALLAITAELARCAINGYATSHFTSSAENGIAVVDRRGRELPRPAGDPHGRELLRLLATLPDGCGERRYRVALAGPAGRPLARSSRAIRGLRGRSVACS